MADVDVTFGAKIDELIQGVNEVKNQLNSIGQVTENLDKQFGFLERIDKRFRDVAGAISGLVSSIVGWAREMGEAGLQAERMYLATGLTGQSLLTLKSAAALAGTDVHDMVQGLARSSLLVQRSATDAFGPAAQALKVLGLNAKELKGIPLDQYFDKLREAVTNLGPGLTRMNALQGLGIRNVQDLMPVLDISKDKLQKFKDAYEAAGAGSSVSIKSFASTRVELILLDKTMESFSKTLFSVAQGPINYMIKSFREWVQTISKDDIHKALEKALDWILWFSGGAITLFEEVKEIIKTLIDKLNELGNAMENAKPKNWFSEWWKEINEFHDKIKGVSSFDDPSEYIMAPPAGLEKQLTVLERATIKLKELKEALKGIKDEWGIGGGKDRPDADTLDVLARKRFEISMKDIDSRIALAGEELNRKQAIYERDFLNLQITEGQKIKLVATASDQRFAAEIALMQKKLTLGGLDIVQRKEIEEKIKLLTEQRITEQLKKENDYIKEVQSQWADILGAVQTSWDSQLRGLLTRTTSWAQAMKNIVLDLVLKIISEFEKLAIVKPLIAALSDAFSPTTLFSDILKSITKMIGQVFAGATAFFAPTLGPAAPAAGAAVAAATEAAAVSYDVGSWNVPETTMAMVHKGEMIIPASPASAMREGGGLGGHNININIHAMDASSFGAHLKGGMGDAITRYVSRALQSNPSMRPGYTR